MPLNRRTTLLAVAALSLAGAAWADAPFGPKVGAKAPEVGALPDQDGKTQTLKTLAGKKGVVLMFYRSSAWCPYCQAQLIAMNDGVAQMEQRGYKLVALSYDKPETAKAFVIRRNITFSLLSDPKSEVIDRWGLRDPQYKEGSMAFGVPRPAIYVIDRKGVIRATMAEETYQKRPPVAEVLKALDGVG